MPRVPERYAPVEDFEKDAKGNPIMDKSDPIKWKRTMEMRHRERWVKVAEARILQEELAECFMREGVNHIQNCKHLAKQYFELIHSPDFGIRKI
eukprot:g1038.t1